MSYPESDENTRLLATSIESPETAVPLQAIQPNKPDPISEVPLYPLNVREFLRTMLIIFRSGFPVSLNMITGVIKGLIAITLVSRYGTPNELAGASLATLFGITFVAALAFTLNQGFGVLGSHLHGAERKKELGTLFQKHLWVILILNVILLTILSFMDYILLAVGTKPEVAKTTGIYLRFTIPSILGLCLSDTIKSFLLAQDDFLIAGISQIVSLLIHILGCYIFVFPLGMPFVGPAIARSITDISTVLLLVGYVLMKSNYREALTDWSKDCLSGWWTHFAQTFMIGFNYYVAQISYIASVILVIYLNNEYATGSHSLAFTILGFFLMIPLGNSLAMQAKMGIAVGQQKKYKAQKLLASGLALNLIICVLFMLIMVLLNRQIIGQVTEVPETNAYLREILYLNCVMLPADAFLDQIAGTLRTLNKENEVLQISIIYYVLFGILAESIASIVLPFGYMGIWYGIVLSLYVSLAMFVIRLVKMDWSEQIRSIQESLETKEEAKTPMLLD